MLAVFDFTPKYCPSCGTLLHIDDDPTQAFRFASYHAATCPNCDLKYQLVPQTEMLRAAAACGGTLADLVVLKRTGNNGITP